MQLSAHRPALTGPSIAPRPAKRCTRLVPAASAPEQGAANTAPKRTPEEEQLLAARRAQFMQQQQQQQQQVAMMRGQDGRRMVMGPDGQPVEMVPMNERPDAFSGVASIDRGENDAPTSPQRAALLAGGDLAVLLAFAAIGRANHGEAVATLDTLGTALPLIVGWFASGAALGGFGADAQGAQAGPAAAAAAKTWAVGVPLGIALRSASRGYVPAASFIGVTLGITCALMVGWRVALAAVTPEPEKLTPAQQAARRSNKTGAITDLFRMVISLTKRW